PALTVGATYTVSLWFLQNTNPASPPFVSRLSGATVIPLFNTAVPIPASLLPASPGATNSVAATLPPFPSVWLHELQAVTLAGPTDNFGQREPWLELYNPGTNLMSLAGLYLGTNYATPAFWAFPSNATVEAGQFLLVWADGQPEQTTATALHT